MPDSAERHARAALDELAARLLEASRVATETGFAVVRHHRNLHPGDVQQLMTALGTLTFTPGERSHPDHEYVFVVTNRGRTQPPKSVFHSDTSYVRRPPSYTLLAAAEIPAAGGQTLFVNQFDALASADPSLKESLAGVEFLHAATRVPDLAAAGSGCWHPALRRHSDQRRIALYVSARERLIGARRNGVVLSDENATALIDEAHRQAVNGATVERHAWQTGDLLLTDNRCTLHAADHSAVRGHRTLHRVMVQGEQPV